MQPSQNFASHQVHVAAGHIKDVPFDGYTGMQTIHSVICQSIPFPWTEAVPEQIRNCFAKSHNTASEYVFVGALATTAVVMGPKSFVKVRESYKEPTNIFAICVGFPGSGKSHGPIESLPSPLSHSCRQIHEKKAYLGTYRITDFDLVQKRQLEGNAERQLYC